MMKHLFFTLFVFTISVFSYGQSWNPIGSTCYSVSVINHDPNSVYFGGNFCEINNNYACKDIAKWTGSNFQQLWNGVHGPYAYIDDIEFLNSLVIAGGRFDSAGNVQANNIAFWTGALWNAMGPGTDSAVSDLCVYNGNLYVAGRFSHAGNITANGLAAWNTNWSAVPAWTGNNAMKLIVWNNLLYVLSSIGNNIFQFASFNGTTWNTLPAFTLSNQSYNAFIFSLETFNGHLFMSGTFDHLNNLPVSGIAEFDGINWGNAGITSMDGAYYPTVSRMKSDGFNLFITGPFDSINHVYINTLASYNGNSWSWFSNYSGQEAGVLDIFQGDMYVSSRDSIYKLNGTLSINNFNSEKNPIKIFPNPAIDVLHFDTGKEKVHQTSIYSLTGEKIISQNNSQNYVPVSTLPPGTYIIEVNFEAASHRSLFVKQ